MVNLNSPAPPAQSTAPLRTAGAALYSVAALALTIALVGLGLAYGIQAWSQSQERPAPLLTATHNVSVGAQRYALPAGLLTDPTQRRDGFAERVDMTLALPLGAGGQLSEVDITIMPRGRVRTSAALLDSVYLRQFSGTHLPGPAGLVGKPLDSDAGTQGETVWYDPLSPAPFVAKCMNPNGLRPEARTCLRVMALSDRNTAIITFAPEALPNWRTFDTRIEDALATLRI